MKHECNNFVKLTSMNKKICSECGKEYEWNLNQDQKPLLNSSRGDRKSHELIEAFDEERMDIIGQNGNDGEVYMCGDRWLETGSPWKE